MAEYKDSTTTVIADVDCTAAGKALCDANGVRGYPSIRYGDPNNLEEYKGGRTLAALKEFAAANLGPTCGPGNLDLCDAEKKAEIEKFQAMPAADLEAAVKAKTEEMDKLEADFKTFVDGLQKSYTDSSEAKDKAVEAVKASGLGLMKAVAAHAKTAAPKTEL